MTFEDIPYGTYRAVEEDDQYFDFVSMLNIEDVPGVQFRQDSKGGVIIISPTGEDIVYGVHVINKIEATLVNPNTGRNILLLLGVLTVVFFAIGYLKYTKKTEKEG